MTQETKKISLILSSDNHEKVQLAGMISSVAAVTGIEVLVFVSMGAVKKFKKGISDDERFSGGNFSKILREKKVPPYIDLFRQGKEFGGVRMFVCPMALEVLGWTKDDMEDNLFDEIAGMTKFLIEADGSQMLNL